MKIQVIAINDTKRWYSDYSNITYSTLNAPQSLDSFDVNIISLQSEHIWRNNGQYANSIDIINDFSSIGTMIENSTKAHNIILLPQNYTFQYYKRAYEPGYAYSAQLKDMIDVLVHHLLKPIVPNIQFDLLYENSQTQCNNSVFDSAFYFDTYSNILTRSEGSGKITTIECDDKFILTTLDLTLANSGLKNFLIAIGLDKDTEEYPEWLYNIDFDDDKNQKDKIETNQTQISELQSDIKTAQDKLALNMRYKSILSENGQNLVDVVFDILEKLLDYDLSEFDDIKKEDFLVQKENITFIGEIKGVTSNVKSEHVSQLDVHYQSYMDKLNDDGKEENVKALLIINPFRSKILYERDEIHANQIKLAERNESLIITTQVLLDIFGRYLKDQITSDDFINTISEKTGLLSLNDFDK